MATCTRITPDHERDFHLVLSPNEAAYLYTLLWCHIIGGGETRKCSGDIGFALRSAGAFLIRDLVQSVEHATSGRPSLRLNEDVELPF